MECSAANTVYAGNADVAAAAAHIFTKSRLGNFDGLCFMVDSSQGQTMALSAIANGS
jgi:hypothetical protein